MNDFNRENRPWDKNPKKFGGRNFGGGNRGFGNRNSARPMFQAVCSKCGKECEVPFRPTGDRPVFCNSCFKSQGNAHAERPREKSFGHNFEKPGIGSPVNQKTDQFKVQLEMLNNKLDKILKVLSPAAVAPEALREDTAKKETKKSKAAAVKVKTAPKKAKKKK